MASKVCILCCGKTCGHLVRPASFRSCEITQDKKNRMVLDLVKPCSFFSSFCLEDAVASEEFLLPLPKPCPSFGFQLFIEKWKFMLF